MAYLHNLDGWHDLQILFEDNNLILDFGLDNCPYIHTKEDDSQLLDYEELPEHLQQALDNFADKHNLNDL